MGRGGEKGLGRGERGGKGAKPHFTRVVPKFLKQYEAMLTGPKPNRDEGQQVFSGMVEYIDDPNIASGSNAAGGGKSVAATEIRTAKNLNASREENAFDGYDEEEVAALEAYMRKHPSRQGDRDALRKRTQELSASIRGTQVESTIVTGIRPNPAVKTAEETNATPLDMAEKPLEYIDASGKLKFNKRRERCHVDVEDDASGEGGIENGPKTGGKKPKRKKIAKLNNANLLSFEAADDD